MACRIGASLVISGAVLDFALHYIWGFDYVTTGVGIFGLLLFPFGICLLAVCAFIRLRERGKLTVNRVSLTSPGLHAGKLQMGSELRPVISQEPYKIHTSSWLLRTTAIAALLCVAGISLFNAFGYWLETRTFEPLDIPVSLSRGHSKTGNFYINLRELYYINVDVDYQFPEDAKCQFGGPDSVLKTRLILYRGGQELGQSDGSYFSSIGYFYADKKGNYDLDVQVLSDASCLNVRHPRIRIQTSADYSGLRFGVGGLAGILFVAGISLLAHSVAAWIISKQSASRKALTIFQDAYSEIYSSRRPLTGRFARLPPFGLFCATTLAVAAVLPMWVLQFAFRPISKGISVSLLRNDFALASTDRLTTPIIIRIENAGPASPPNLYLNSTPVTWESLHDALKVELARRADWVVYVRGDEDIRLQYAVSVMEIIRGEHAKVILLTPNTEKLVPTQ
jgi:biopolymer transport protein ExbD